MARQDCFLQYAVDVCHTQALQVISDPDNILGQHIGNGVWTAAQELAKFMRARADSIRDRHVLELGAGLGLVGQVRSCVLAHSESVVVHQRYRVCKAQAMALSGAHVVLSDTEQGMQLLCMNTEANKQAIEASSGKCTAISDFLAHACGIWNGMPLMPCPEQFAPKHANTA